jgi:hypothetical protein
MSGAVARESDPPAAQRAERMRARRLANGVATVRSSRSVTSAMSYKPTAADDANLHC